MTIIMAVLAWIFLPDFPQRAKFLNEEERIVAVMRLLKGTSNAVNPEFDRRAYFSPLKTWRFYMFALIGSAAL